MFVGKTRSLPLSGSPECCYAQASLSNMRLDWKSLAGTKTIAYPKHLQINKVKSFIAIGPGALHQLR